MGNGKKYKFSGHQTFAFRYGWLEKGVRAVEERPAIFSQDDALVRLGVGKNMVESIKHWCLVAQMIEEHRDDGSQAFRVSDIGKKLLLDWDPFLEDDASLWLVHWLLATNPHVGTTWQLMFGEFFRPDFTKKEVVEYVLSCLYGTNSPGQVFKLDENSLLQYIEEIAALTREDVLLDETAGLKQIYRNRPFDACRLLTRHYGREARK